jgi:predicted nucleic acid-binding protein
MYLVGAPHPNKDRTISLLSQLVQSEERLVTDVEVYQEILHRYTSIDRVDAIDAACEVLDSITDDVLTYGMLEIRTARSLIGSIGGLSARDALHLAVMRRAGITRILSFDHGFDACPGVDRVS